MSVLQSSFNSNHCLLSERLTGGLGYFKDMPAFSHVPANQFVGLRPVEALPEQAAREPDSAKLHTRL